jgi:cyclin-C
VVKSPEQAEGPVMAANYWSSTQKSNWTFSRDKLADLRDEQEKQHSQLITQHPYPDRRLMFIFLRDRLLQLAKRLQFRQQCVATALVYLHRYFLSTPMQGVNLYLLTATAFYLASKTEESPHHIRIVASEARQAWPEFVPGDVSRLGEMEFCLISEMRSQLIIWHPYRTLIDLKENQDLKLTSDELGLAWCIVNDSYMTDLPLTCPPHIMAVIAMFLAVVFYPYTRSNALRPTDQANYLNPDSNSFQSIGRAQGMAGVLGGAMHGLPMNPPTTAASAQTNGTSRAGGGGNNNNDAPRLIVGDRAQTMATIQQSEKYSNLVEFMVNSDINLNDVFEGMQEIISLYHTWEEYSEKSIKDAVSRCLKSNGIDN